MLALSATGACAFIDVHVETDVPVVAGRRVAARGVEVALLPAIDERRDSRRLGVVKNGFDWDTAAVLARGDVMHWVDESLSKSLQKSGLQAKLVDEGFREPGPVLLRVTVLELFYEPKIGAFEGENAAKVVLDAMVELPDGRRFERRFSGQLLERMNDAIVPRAGREADTLRSALADALGELVFGIDELLRETGYAR